MGHCTFDNNGRLGNYLYEFACAWSYAKKHNLKFTVPLEESNPIWAPILFKHLRDYSYDDTKQTVNIYENTHAYQHLPFKEEWRDYNIKIWGYRQSYKYFDAYKDELLEMFNFPYEKNEGVCAVHIRRGDYVNYPTKHPTVTLDYLSKAINIIIDKLGFGIKYKIFSDDIDWCKQYIPGMYGKEVEYSENKSAIEDLILMANCEHQICSNSTMSTWASELNRNPDKIVIVPSEDNWFGEANKHLSVKDMYRPEWIQIKY